MCVCVCTYPHLFPSIPIHPSIHPSIYLSISLSICLSTSQTVRNCCNIAHHCSVVSAKSPESLPAAHNLTSPNPPVPYSRRPAAQVREETKKHLAEPSQPTENQRGIEIRAVHNDFLVNYLSSLDWKRHDKCRKKQMGSIIQSSDSNKTGKTNIVSSLSSLIPTITSVHIICVIMCVCACHLATLKQIDR